MKVLLPLIAAARLAGDDAVCSEAQIQEAIIAIEELAKSAKVVLDASSKPGQPVPIEEWVLLSSALAKVQS